MITLKQTTPKRLYRGGLIALFWAALIVIAVFLFLLLGTFLQEVGLGRNFQALFKFLMTAYPLIGLLLGWIVTTTIIAMFRDGGYSTAQKITVAWAIFILSDHAFDLAIIGFGFLSIPTDGLVHLFSGVPGSIWTLIQALCTFLMGRVLIQAKERGFTAIWKAVGWLLVCESALLFLALALSIVGVPALTYTHAVLNSVLTLVILLLIGKALIDESRAMRAAQVQ